MTALFCVNRSLKLAPASVVVPYQYSMIVWAVIFGFVVFGDVPSIATIVGAVIIIGAGFYIYLARARFGAPRRRRCSAGLVPYLIRRALLQLFSDDHTPRERRKQSTGVEEPSARKRCSCTPLHWKPHFSSTLREAGLVTRAPA